MNILFTKKIKVYKVSMFVKTSSLQTVSISPGDLCGRRMILFSFSCLGEKT